MEAYGKVSSGLKGFDIAIDSLRLGDNVVWQVDSIESYKKLIDPFVQQAIADNRRVIYVHFDSEEALLQEQEGIIVYELDAEKGFEHFATEVHHLVKQEGKYVFYVFDCLTDLLAYWSSDLMIGNFFEVTCPYLFELETIAYFAIIRNIHTFSTIAGIRETTQLLVDLYQIKDRLYVHPLKVWQRYSPTMFFPHLIQGQEAECITSSAQTAELFSQIQRGEERLDYWNVIFQKAREALHKKPEQQRKVIKQLLKLLVGKESRLFNLCAKYFSLQDLLDIASREIGTGYIGGKSIGMLLARKILETQKVPIKDSTNINKNIKASIIETNKVSDNEISIAELLEPHDSYYLGADIFYTYIVKNGLWRLRTKQKSLEGYERYAPELKEKLLKGKFPDKIKEQFLQMLEYFGQSPIIVRSSSIQEDNFGNAFAGKYESVFCVNQGTLSERYESFTNAVRIVYSSTMNEDALNYRKNRGLSDKDEQMAILVQRVSGDYHGNSFYPDVAGVGNSSNLYVWDQNMDMEAGMLRLVYGLGTRAVDRTEGDYVRIVSLDDPLRLPLINYEDQNKYSQHFVDILSINESALTSKPLQDILSIEPSEKRSMLASIDYQTMDRLRDRGQVNQQTRYLMDFKKLLKDTEFPNIMKDILLKLSTAYEYPVDIEFTANLTQGTEFRINLLQCRPLQTRGLGKTVELPKKVRNEDYLFKTKGNFMGGNLYLSLDYVVLVSTTKYLQLSEQDKYQIARFIGRINLLLKDYQTMLIGPGRWGTTTTSLGVPVHFTELCHMSVICEVASSEEGFQPELSYGSHFFQDLVEAGIFYAAIFDGQKDVKYFPEKLVETKNYLPELCPDAIAMEDVLHIAKTDGLELFSDIVSQTLLCRYHR